MWGHLRSGAEEKKVEHTGDSSEVRNIVLICADKMGMKIDMDYRIDPGVMDG